MRVKTDFVTNSSSTSFIIVDIPNDYHKHIDKEILEKHYNDLDDFEKNEYSISDVIKEIHNLANGGESQSYLWYEMEELLEDLGFYVDTIEVENGGGDGNYVENIHGLTPKEIISKVKEWVS